jgi:hypothetical protein
VSDLLDKYLHHYDPLFLGTGRRALANGMHATLGQMFPRRSGGCNLYRGVGSPEQIDWEDPVGAAGQDATTIRNFRDRGHDADSVYYYAIRAVSPGGVEQEDRDQIACLSFDSTGKAIIPSLNAPCDLHVESLDAGRFKLNWYYGAAEVDQSPREFRVYSNSSAGVVDYNTPVASVPFKFWQRHYEYLTPSFDQGTVVTWAVRAVNSADQEERNTATVFATAETAGPAPIDDVRAD